MQLPNREVVMHKVIIYITLLNSHVKHIYLKHLEDISKGSILEREREREGEREKERDWRRSVFEVFLIGLKSFHRCGQLLGDTSQRGSQIMLKMNTSRGYTETTIVKFWFGLWRCF